MPTPQKPARITDEEIEHRFGYHRATFPDGYNPATDTTPLADFAGVFDADGKVATAPLHAQVREVYRNAAKALVRMTPPGREQALMLTHLQESSMWANAAVAMQSPLIKE